MKTTYQLSPMTASTIAHCYDALRTALTFSRELANSKESPSGIKTVFTHISTAIDGGEHMPNTPIQRIKRGIVKVEEFEQHIEDADPLIFKNIQYLYSRMTKEKKELLELAAEHILKGGKIDFEDDKVKEMPQRPTDKEIMETIIKIVTEKKQMEHSVIVGKARYRTIVYTRQLCMYVIRKKTKLKLKVIGRRFNRDHTTVIDSVQQIQNLIDTDLEIREDVAYFMELDYTRQEVGLKVAV